MIFLWKAASSNHLEQGNDRPGIVAVFENMKDTITLHVSGSDISDAISGRDYNRLLQLPRDRELEGELLDRAEKARAWYSRFGNPFVASKRVDVESVTQDSILLETGACLHSLVLAQRFVAGQAHALMVLAASAGTEVAEEVAKHWTEGRPDEGFFLDRFAVCVTEHLLFWAAATLCRSSESAQETLLPHLSPGCGHWDLNDQHKLMSLLTGVEGGATLGPLTMLSSGGLHPQHSVLAVMGVTHQNYGVTPESLCRSCDMNPCKFRRAPYSGAALHLLEIR